MNRPEQRNWLPHPEAFFRDQRVLVTGGAGFVGTNLVRALSAYPLRRLTVLDDLFTGRRENLEGVDHDFVEGTVAEYEQVADLVAEADVVFHLATRNIIVSTKHPQEDFSSNTQGTFNVLEACRNLGVARVVYTSSVSVYGNVVHLPIAEADPLYPLNPYAASKLCGESYCHAYFETYGVPATVVRYSNVYGTWQSPTNPYCGVVSRFIDRALAGEPVLIHGDGEQTRDYTEASDAVEATILAAASPQAVGGTFNVGTGIEVSVNRLASLIGEALEARGLARGVDVRHVDRRDIDNVRRRVLSIEHARRVLRWQPKVAIREGLERTIDWILATGGVGAEAAGTGAGL